MVKLSEEMIVARTRVSDMTNVKKLNCWGAELSDITVLRKLVNVEVLSLSVNCISTLADIQNCRNLQELYIRKNKIRDLSEICWLRDLKKLKSLWLEENPCVLDHGESYRQTVIRNLPQLQKLDNVTVQPDEMADAMRRGQELVHPMDLGGSEYIQPGDQQQYEPDPSYESVQSRRSSSGHYDRDSSYDRRQSDQYNSMSQMRRGSSQHQLSHQQPQQQPSYVDEMPPPTQQTPQQQQFGGPDYHIGRRFSHQDAMGRSSSTVSATYGGTSSMTEAYRRMSVQEQQHQGTYEEAAAHERRMSGRSYGSVDYQFGGGAGGGPYNSYQNYDSRPAVANNQQRPQSSTTNLSRDNLANSERDLTTSAGEFSDRAVVQSYYEDAYEKADAHISTANHYRRKLSASRTSIADERPYPERPRNRSSNILSAVLCLIKEMDSASLEVAEMAIRCRLEELEG